MPQSHLGEPDSKMGNAATAKGILKSISEGIRTLVVIDERLAALGEEGKKTRAEVRTLVENLSRLMGQFEERDKRLSERFSELDKRLSQSEKLVELKVELAIRDRLEKLDISKLSAVSMHNS